ncbi:DUF5123 domain-containing protein [Chitinophaga tropicalis]|uniref:DUF5123 domain-containing protein n=1 Tax=Chitinophaga tropicalis TaxID=2683588 RepID=A0A7K1U0J5_9BACT|nr:DUF5123 domain-containing protein [Chitinophaga tropicalis]MVT07888.1 DUF5123 domain-containing protein [Chitinophaga tropicalis]
MKKILILLAIAYTACKKDANIDTPRLFRPVRSGELAADSNTIVASWQKITGAVSYQLQVSRDTFRTTDLSLPLDTNIAVVKKLLFNQLYQLRVRAVAADTVQNSKWSDLGAVKTSSSILKVPGIDDLTYNSVRIRWATKGAAVSSIKIVKSADGSLVSETPLAAEDLVNEYKVIGGLEASTGYTAFLYSGEEERGYADFTTKVPFSGIVVDLTSFVGRPGILADTLPFIPSGSTVLLKRGETYNISSTISFNKSLIFMSAPDLANTTQAKIFFTSNFNFEAGATIDSLEFNDVYMMGDNYGSRYVFNNSNSANVGKLKFMNSRIEIFRGMTRLQAGTTTVNDFIISNCIIDSIGNYFVLNIGSSSKVNKISISNSTLYKVEGVVSSAQSSVAVLVTDCTFNEAPLGNSKNYYIDYGSNSITDGITVTNCIFGIGKYSAGAITVKGFRAVSGIINVGNNYRTSDHLSAGNDFPNITPYTRPVSQLWQDAAAGNFKIADNAFPGRNSTGDPRWR